MTGDIAIEVKGLNSFYGTRQVLYDVSALIPRHEIFVIMGISGSGKTTLFRHLIGLKETPSGCIWIDGEDVGRWGSSEWNNYHKRIGVLFQNGALFNSLTVGENVATPLRVHTGLPGEIIDIMVEMKLHMVGLSGLSGFMPSQLSGGMRKRAGLARALAMDPEFLFVDEPSSGLDPITAAGLDELLLSLKAALGMTVIVVTHELESAFRIADRMMVMDRGRILASGTPDEIRRNDNPRVRQFLERRAEEAGEDVEAYLERLCAVRRR
ncbi:ABC transporter ATP-binding protein [Thermodesulforhabdus norvegica]|uniref:Phospholipid/cholesterol/gamma-HCH transport system ATP-binding protein n=1 Tax=Thermodesulforhabdus norvegica TaxID=39841 RepID=A0A1I4QPJ3_9BACT|nr:ATP-binding cassette domain-containing protein [Thermodesulforhabdus norvegica]SFM41951.1 phospholipid/cholesterol/gamma-HCH transport system ATP-binding protein [Thermodesulforhabdus norvegica]